MIGKIAGLIILLFAGYFSLDLLNYKNWAVFFTGLLIVIISFGFAIYLIYTIIKKYSK